MKRARASKGVASVRQQLLQALEHIDRPGTFCTAGRAPAVVPGLEIAGVGAIALPLGKRQAAAIRKQAHQAPYGKGTRTLVDTDVRRVWEIDADKVAFANPEWTAAVAETVDAARTGLGLEGHKLEPHLYKALLYEPGSFFLSHRDGEKLDRMVATLVVALPSEHEGGELVVRHDGREETVDFGPDSRFHAQFAAFYADCEHEIRPVTSGYRLALVYNLTLAKSKRKIAAPTRSTHVAEIVPLLKAWSAEAADAPESDDGSRPSKLAVVLDHEYTQAGLTRDVLKGIDRARADVLFEAASQSDYDASLALVTYWQSGSAEPSGDYGYSRRHRYDYDEDDEDEDDEDDASEHVMGEVFDESLMAEHFSDADGKPLAFGEVPLEEDEIVSAIPLTDGEPDKEDFEGYTGNAGMTLERWYHRAAIVLWPAESRFDVLCEAGVESAVGGLEQMVRRLKKARKAEQPPLREQCVDFAKRIIAHWPARKHGRYGRPYHPARTTDMGADAALLPLLETLDDASLIAAWIRGVLAKDASLDPGKSLGDACKQRGWLTFRDELRELFEETSNETLERHARLLADLSLRRDKNADRKSLCSDLAHRLTAAVERWAPPQERDWDARKIDRAELLPPLVQSFLALGELDLLDRLVAYVLKRPKEFDLTTVQMPAVVKLRAWLAKHVKSSSPPLRRWLTALQGELQPRAADPPTAPTDWRRPASISCTCADCKALSRFLADPDEQTLRLPLAKARRQHLHNTIDRDQLDTTHVTEHRGNPHTLVCTKTTGSHQRALKAHQVDVDHLATVNELVNWHDNLAS